MCVCLFRISRARCVCRSAKGPGRGLSKQLLKSHDPGAAISGGKRESGVRRRAPWVCPAQRTGGRAWATRAWAVVGRGEGCGKAAGGGVSGCGCGFFEGCGCSSVEVRDNISEALDNTSGVRDNAEGLCTITRRGDPVRHGIISVAMEI